MVQLSNDCLACDELVLTVEAAAARAVAGITAVEAVETVPLALAAGRVLAADLIAPRPLPGFANAAVDGYAVRHADLAATGTTDLPVLDRIIAGDGTARSLNERGAVRIFTGAPIPAGCDTVFMQEDVELLEDHRVRLPPGLSLGANLRPAGEDVALGDVALPEGRRLAPQDLAMAAALGLPDLPVRRRVRVAVFSTGNEVVEPGAALPPGGLYDANRAMLIALLERLGAAVVDCGILPDSRAAVAAALRTAAQSADLILTTGGVSTGEEDHVRAALHSEGTLAFWRLAIKPGRPVAMGTVGTTPFMGLPGNPVAVFVTFCRLARPLLDARAGALAQELPVLRMPAAFAYRKKPGRREFVRVFFGPGREGASELHLHPNQGAGMISSLTGSDALAELPEDLTRLTPGEMVTVLPFAGLLD